MAEKGAVTTIYSFIISGGAVIIVGLTTLIIKSWMKNIDSIKTELKDDLAEHKGAMKESNEELKKDLGEAFTRVRKIETKLTVVETKCENNHIRGIKNEN